MINQLLQRDVSNARGIFHILKFEARGRKSGNDIVAPTPFEVQHFSNLLTNTGGALNEDLLIGAGGTVYSNANAYIGSGDSATAVNATHTDLQAATNKLRKAMSVSYPSRSGQIITWQSLFATTDANWQWNEMAIFNASSAGTMFARGLVASPFTKTSALSITAQYTWSLS